MVQWAIELSQFDIEYKPRTAIKAQTLADFVAEFTMTNLDPKAEYWKVHVDGSSIAGVGGVGVILLSPKKDALKYGVQFQFPATNNEAKYEAVLTSLKVAKALGIGNLKLNINSKLVVKQITNKYEAKEDRMKMYLKLTNQLLSNFDDVRIGQIPREENLEADKVARLASSNNGIGQLGLYMEVQTISSIEVLDVAYVQSKGSWMDLILAYIKDGRLLSDPLGARKIRVRSFRFIIRVVNEPSRS